MMEARTFYAATRAIESVEDALKQVKLELDGEDDHDHALTVHSRDAGELGWRLDRLGDLLESIQRRLWP